MPSLVIDGCIQFVVCISLELLQHECANTRFDMGCDSTCECSECKSAFTDVVYISYISSQLKEGCFMHS